MLKLAITCLIEALSNRISMADLTFHLDFWSKIMSEDEAFKDEEMLSSLSWYSDIFMIAVHSKNAENMEGFFVACMLVLDSIVVDESFNRFQCMLLSCLLHVKEHLPASLFLSMRSQVLKFKKLLKWLIKEAFRGLSDAKNLLDSFMDVSEPIDDALLFQTCVLFSVEIMSDLGHSAEYNRSNERAHQKSGSLQFKLAVFKSIFNAFIAVPSPHKSSIDFLRVGISRETSLNSLDCIIKHLTECASASFRKETTDPRESIPAFSLFGDTLDFLSKALQVYQLQNLQDKMHIHFIYALFIELLEISAKTNSVTFMQHAALVCNEQLLNIFDDSQKQNISNVIVTYLSPKLQQLQAGTISGLNYEAVFSVALKLMVSHPHCSTSHRMVKATALLLCNLEEKIAWTVKIQWISHILTQSYINSISNDELEQLLSAFKSCFKVWSLFSTEDIDCILTGLSTLTVILCSQVDFLGSFSRNFLQIASLLPSSTVLNFLDLISEVLLQVPLLHLSLDILKAFPSDLLETVCDCLISEVQPSLLWYKIFVVMTLKSSISSFDLYGESLILEYSAASEFGVAASKQSMAECTLELEVAFFSVLHTLDFTQDRLFNSRFLDHLCSTCPSMTSSIRVNEVALSIVSRLKNVDVCCTQLIESLKRQHLPDSYHTNAFTCRCRMGVIMACQSRSNIEIASEVWNISSNMDGYIYLMQHLKHHLSSLLKFGTPIQKEFMKILSFCPGTSELVSFVFEFQCAPIYALQAMVHLLKMQPEQKVITEKNIGDLILYLRRWNTFLLDSRKSTAELDRIWCCWIDLWSSLAIHLSFDSQQKKQSHFIQNLTNLIDENTCRWLIFTVSAMHMHDSNQNRVVVKAFSLICKFWLEQGIKLSGFRKSTIERFMLNPELLKDQHCGFYFEAYAKLHLQLERRLISAGFQMEIAHFSCLANLFYIQCSTSASKSYHTIFRILELMDHLYTKELIEAATHPGAIIRFLKNFACAFGVFNALHSDNAAGNSGSKLYLVPFLSIIFMRTNSTSKDFSENCQRELYLAFHDSIECLKLIQPIMSFALESKEMQLVSEYRKALHFVDINLVNNSKRYPTKKYEAIICRLSAHLNASVCDRLSDCHESDILRTSRSFCSRRIYDDVCKLN